MVMLHNGADHTTIAIHDQPAPKPLSRSVNRVTYIRKRIHQVNGHADGILTEAGPDQIRDGSRLDVPAGFLERATSGCFDELGAI